MGKKLYSQSQRKIAQKLRSYREAAGLTQRDLAAKIDCPQNTVVRIEQGQRRIDFFDWISLCHACNVDPVKEGHDLLKTLDASSKQ